MAPSSTLLLAVKAADNAPGPYSHPDATSHPKTWEEDDEELYPFHLTLQDHEHGGIVPVGWIRPRVIDFILNQWPADALGERTILEVTTECVYFADWVLDDGTEGMDTQIARLAGFLKENGYFSECLEGWLNMPLSLYMC